MMPASNSDFDIGWVSSICALLGTRTRRLLLNKRQVSLLIPWAYFDGLKDLEHCHNFGRVKLRTIVNGLTVRVRLPQDAVFRTGTCPAVTQRLGSQYHNSPVRPTSQV
ncbi:hypothetical protein LshimejAT787_0603690 [Lyophyllum shimeji]|uniref:Uncharacterized protein n=1 Tax=Lyophyllum shimeji TaxID=47721 RepID=A0A9P3UND3_LYOSH|nr:hypothetical protein LshimejAT787_0603690 [Lyophyllum shimeji]